VICRAEGRQAGPNFHNTPKADLSLYRRICRKGPVSDSWTARSPRRRSLRRSRSLAMTPIQASPGDSLPDRVRVRDTSSSICGGAVNCESANCRAVASELCRL
jgi:hypothetical protein